MSDEPIKRKVEIDLEVDTTTTDSSKNPFQKLINIAKAVDAWRVFPRLFIGVYIYIFYEFSMWIMALKIVSTQQASLYSVVTGIGAAWFGAYVASGKKD
jgi:ABC-type anion transport system duplicated permease subunit